MADTTTSTSSAMTASAVFRQLRAAPSDAGSYAAQLDLVRQLVQGKIELHLPRKARARALLEWAAGRCAARDGPNTPSSILDPEYWNLFSQILSLKDDTIASVSNPSSTLSDASNLLSKSDIRQIVLLSKGISLLNALKTCLEAVPTLLAEQSVPSSAFGSAGPAGGNKAALLLTYLHQVFARLFPLSLSSPTTTLDGLLPVIHAFIRSSASLASTSSASVILPQWTQIGQLLQSTLSSLVKTSSNPQSTTANDKLLLRKVAASFLDQSGGYTSWKSFTSSYSTISALCNGEHVKSASSKGKGKATSSTTTNLSVSTDFKALLDVFNGFIATSILSPANLARYFSISSGTSLDSPKQAQEALSELFGALKASIRDTSASTSAIAILPRLVQSYIETLTSNSHELFAPLRRGRADTSNTNASGTNAGSNAPGASSRSAVEYQVQMCFRHAVFGMLQGCVQLLRETTLSTSTITVTTQTGKSSPKKRQRETPAATGSDVEKKAATAEALRLVLAQVQERNIYITGGGEANRSWLRVLQDCARFAVVDLSNADRSSSAEILIAAMQAATHIAKMDYTALQDVLPNLLKLMAHHVPSGDKSFAQPCDTLLDSALAYNGKIRQLPDFITAIEETISSIVDEAASENEDRDAATFAEKMDDVSRSPLLSRHATARLSKECRASLGATQTPALLKSLLSKLQALITQAEQESSQTSTPAQPPKKKSKSARTSTGGAPTASAQQEATSWKIYAISHLIQAILASGAMKTAASTNEAGYSEVDALLSSVKEEEQKHLDGIAEAHTAAQRTEVALLQLSEAWASTREESPDSGSSEVSSLLATLAKSASLTPTLHFEIMRSLLFGLASSASTTSLQEHAPKLFEHITALLSVEKKDSSSWDGHLHALQQDHLPVALWWLLATKYMDVFEQSATEQQLSSLVQFIFTHSATAPVAAEDTVSIPAITGRLLRSADFFELTRIRDATEKYVREVCASSQLSQTHLDILLLLPKEYLATSLKRKVVLALSEQKDAVLDERKLLALLKFTKDDSGNPLIKDLDFLKALTQKTKTENHAILITRLYEQLLTMMLQNWSASPDSFAQLPDLLDSLPAGDKSSNSSLQYLTWRVLSSETKASSIPQEIRVKLIARIQKLDSSSSVQARSVPQMHQQLEAAITAQIVSRWLQSADDASDGALKADEQNAQLAKSTAATLLQHAEVSDSTLEATVYLALELASMNLPSAILDFEAFVVIYWLLAQKFSLKGVRFATLLAKTCSVQSEETYQAAVSAISEAASPNVNPQALASTLQTLAILLCNPPETAMRVASQAFSATLRRIVLLATGAPLHALPPASLEAITSFVKSFLEQRIGVPEVHDVAAIWSILHDILTPGGHSMPSSQASVGSVATKIFNNCVEIVSVLATHRRDHIIPTFPQVCRILNDILQLLRLSGVTASSSTVASGAQFPAWSLAENGHWIRQTKCSKSVARLLLGLGTRTTVLQRSSARNKGAASASVVSLAGPLSKHAPFIMVNYLTAATDSRFALSPEMRKDINPGILEIVSTMGKSEREALMKGYLHDDQEAERVLLRVMWKEFDAVRYKGD